MASAEHRRSRKATPPDTELQVLDLSRRRCCFCAYWDGDWRQKRGQIAHVDRDRTNNALENLAFLCFDHHAEYDVKSTMQKRYGPDELVLYRNRLHSEVVARIERGVQYTAEEAVVPYVIPVGGSFSPPEASIRLKNFSGTPGLIRVLLLATRDSTNVYGHGWRGRAVIEGSGTIEKFSVEPGEAFTTDVADGKTAFSIEVCDLAEVVTRERTGTVGQRFETNRGEE